MLLEPDCWLLELGCVLLEPDCWLLELGCVLLEPDCWLLELGCVLPELGCSLLELGCVLPELGCALLEPDCWLLELGCVLPDDRPLETVRLPEDPLHKLTVIWPLHSSSTLPSQSTAVPQKSNTYSHAGAVSVVSPYSASSVSVLSVKVCGFGSFSLTSKFNTDKPFALKSQFMRDRSPAALSATSTVNVAVSPGPNEFKNCPFELTPNAI